MEPRDTFASTTVRKTVVFFPDPVTGTRWHLPPNGDRVLLMFMAQLGFVQVIPDGPVVTNDQTSLDAEDVKGSINMVPNATEASMIVTLDFGTYGPLTQGGWTVVSSGNGLQLVIFEVIDNPPVRHNLGCN